MICNLFVGRRVWGDCNNGVSVWGHSDSTTKEGHGSYGQSSAKHLAQHCDDRQVIKVTHEQEMRNYKQHRCLHQRHLMVVLELCVRRMICQVFFKIAKMACIWLLKEWSTPYVITAMLVCLSICGSRVPQYCVMLMIWLLQSRALHSGVMMGIFLSLMLFQAFFCSGCRYRVTAYPDWAVEKASTYFVPHGQCLNDPHSLMFERLAWALKGQKILFVPVSKMCKYS